MKSHGFDLTGAAFLVWLLVFLSVKSNIYIYIMLLKVGGFSILHCAVFGMINHDSS